MKILYSFFILIAFSACKSKTDAITNNRNEPMQTECPAQGNCNIYIQENMQLLLKVEEATGYLYPEIVDGNSSVIVFNYREEAPEGIVDGNYSESIHFEIPRDFTRIHMKDTQLSDVKLLFGKHCFCEDAGYYEVVRGELSANRQGSKIHLELSFEVDGVDFKIQHITETLNLK